MKDIRLGSYVKSQDNIPGKKEGIKPPKGQLRYIEFNMKPVSTRQKAS